MSEEGGFELFQPQEGQAGAREGLSEAAKQRFAAAAAAMQQLRREEKRAKKKDDQVARTIIQFLHDPAHTRFFILISKLVARNCPSIFILAILSLIHKDCLNVVEEYFKELEESHAQEMIESTMQLIESMPLGEGTNRQLIEWITRLQMVLAHDAERIIGSLMLDDRHLDGSLLQLTIFVLQEFFLETEQKDLPYEAAQPLTASILQTVLEPFLGTVNKNILEAGTSDPVGA